MDAGRTFVEAKSLHAFCNSPGTNKHHFLAQRAQLGNLFYPFFNGSMIKSFPVIGHQRRANFDNDALRFLDNRFHDEEWKRRYSMTLNRGSSTSIDSISLASSSMTLNLSLIHI